MNEQDGSMIGYMEVDGMDKASLEELKQASDDLRYVCGVNTDWVTGRRDGLTDDQAEARARAAYNMISDNVDALIDAAIARSSTDVARCVSEAVDRAIKQCMTALDKDNIYESPFGHVSVFELNVDALNTILTALRQYQPVSEPCEHCAVWEEKHNAQIAELLKHYHSSMLGAQIYKFCPNCGHALRQMKGD